MSTHLVHTSIREQEGRVLIGNGRRGRDEGVVPVLEELEKFFADAYGRPVAGHSGDAMVGIGRACPR